MVQFGKNSLNNSDCENEHYAICQTMKKGMRTNALIQTLIVFNECKLL